jgi:hypothetical protein
MAYSVSPIDTLWCKNHEHPSDQKSHTLKGVLHKIFKFKLFSVSPRLGDLGAEIKIVLFYLGQMLIILSLPAYMQCTLATIFDFELSKKRVVSDSLEVHLNGSQ